jgi:hypothetical protein
VKKKRGRRRCQVREEETNEEKRRRTSPKMVTSIGSAYSPAGYSRSLTLGITQTRSTSVIAFPISVDMTPRPPILTEEGGEGKQRERCQQLVELSSREDHQASARDERDEPFSFQSRISYSSEAMRTFRLGLAGSSGHPMIAPLFVGTTSPGAAPFFSEKFPLLRAPRAAAPIGK